MVRRVTSPIRTEPLFDDQGKLNIRYATYLENSAEAINENSSDLELLTSLNIGNAANAAIFKALDELDFKINNSQEMAAVSQLLKRVNGLENQTSLMSLASLSGFQKKIRDLEKQINLMSPASLSGFQQKILSVEIASGVTSFTSNGSQILICNNTGTLTLTLNTLPANPEHLYIKRNAVGAVNFVGTIDGDSSASIASTGDGIHIIHTLAQAEWGAF